MIRQIVLNGEIVEYDFQEKEVKNINLRITPNQEVKVSANSSVDIYTIEEFMRSRAEYIQKALQYYREIEKYAPKPKRFLDGESVSILGHERRLKIIKNTINFVDSDISYVYLNVKESENYEMKKRVYERWINNECKKTVNSVCESVYQKFKKYEIEYPEISFRNMISRWGSCQPKRKKLTFNYQLIEVPMFCIEYVVMHEFTHFLHPNHSVLFYQQLSTFMPDWKERKDALEKSSILKV